MLIEIILIVLCIVAAGRFRSAKEKGVSKYILGVWGTWLGAFILAILFGSGTGSVAVIYIIIGIGYIAEIGIAVSAMKAGKSYMEYWAIKKEAEERGAQEENRKLAEKVEKLQKQVTDMKPSAQQTADTASPPAAETAEPVSEQAGTAVNAGKSADSIIKNGGKANFSNKFLIFIAYVGAMELVDLYGHKLAKDMIGIDKVDWQALLMNKYPSAKSMSQMIISNNEWSHPCTGNIDIKIDMNPFLTAATKHMTDIMGLPPEEAVNAIMITANNNITVAAHNGLRLGQGFVVIGVPIK